MPSMASICCAAYTTRLAEAAHDADDEAGDAVIAPAVAAAERVVPDEALQAPVPRQRAGAVQDRRRRDRRAAGRHARRKPNHRPQEQREQGLHMKARASSDNIWTENSLARQQVKATAGLALASSAATKK